MKEANLIIANMFIIASFLIKDFFLGFTLIVFGFFHLLLYYLGSKIEDRQRDLDYKIKLHDLDLLEEIRKNTARGKKTKW